MSFGGASCSTPQLTLAQWIARAARPLALIDLQPEHEHVYRGQSLFGTRIPKVLAVSRMRPEPKVCELSHQALPDLNLGIWRARHHLVEFCCPAARISQCPDPVQAMATATAATADSPPICAQTSRVHHFSGLCTLVIHGSGAGFRSAGFSVPGVGSISCKFHHCNNPSVERAKKAACQLFPDRLRPSAEPEAADSPAASPSPPPAGPACLFVTNQNLEPCMPTDAESRKLGLYLLGGVLRS